MAFLHQQPGKGFYTLFAIAFNLARLPLWLLLYLVPFLRPNPRWTFSQAIRVRVLRAFLYNLSMVRMRIPMSLEPGKQGDRWVVLEPAQSKYFVGVAVKDSEIRPEKIGGTWYPASLGKGVKAHGGFVVLHFHGGAFVVGDGRDDDFGFAAKTLLASTPASHVFCPQYRLAQWPLGRFPAHLQDAITSYCYLVFELGVEPENIVLSGDSAGANIALALLRYIADHGQQLGLPSPLCAWLWSPWVNPKSCYYDAASMEKGPNSSTDYLVASFGSWGAWTVAPASHSGLSPEHPYLNPVDSAFATPTPLYISSGECEALLPEDTKLYDAMSKVKGNRVKFQIESKAPHDIILVGETIGFVEEAKQAARGAGEFLKNVVSAPS